jgi:[ribosomal protein S18]-alanine N-acetyltransferase
MDAICSISPMVKVQECIIGRMQEDDIKQILEIENVSFPTPWHREIFVLELNKPSTLQLVSKINDKVTGYIISWMMHDEIHILNVAVHPDFRRRGIAKRLINDVTEYFYPKGAKSIILEVRINNKSAQSLYHNLGFKTLRIRKKYYSDTGEDAIVMCLDLDNIRAKQIPKSMNK